MPRRSLPGLALLVVCVVAAATLGPAGGAKRPRPTPCEPGRFLVIDPPPLITGGNVPAVDAIVVDPTSSGRSVAIDSGCAPRRPRLKLSRKGTSVRVRWPACGADTKVRFSARIAADCGTMQGTVRVAKAGARPFTAVRSMCGDGLVDAGGGEACEEDADCGLGTCAGCRCIGVPTTTSTLGSTTSTSTSITTSTAIGATSSTTTTTPEATTSTIVGSTSTTSSTTTTTLVGTPPPDPSTVVPPQVPGQLTSFGASTAFLRTSGIQTGADEGAFDARRAAVVRGRVLDAAGAPIPGVRIAVLDQPELGQTLTRADGAFDLSVNGGGTLIVRYEKPGLIPAQRSVDVPWSTFVTLPDVVLLAASPIVTAITPGAAGAQEALGETIADDDGTRRALVIVPPGTTATMELPDGSMQALGTLHVRITEFTVGERGPEAMPAALPPSSGYTYAAELSVDEAVAAGAVAVRFSQPVVHYVDNFLDIPVGTQVPAGYYERTTGTWMASPDGRVVRIVGVTAGRADLDLDGDGDADDPATLAIGVAERERLAARYAVGQELWRTPMPRFSPWDCNFPYGPNPNDRPPDPKRPPDDRKPKRDEPCAKKGSVIECEPQVLGEDVPIAGTGLQLHYRSDRVPGRTAARTIHIPLTNATVPPRVKRIVLELSIAGRQFTETFPPSPDLVHTFVWDGLDAYGRPTSSGQQVFGRIGWVFDAIYQTPAEQQSSFAALSGVPMVGNPARREITLFTEFRSSIFGLDARLLGLGGWSLGVHHLYDGGGRIWRGDGTVQDVAGAPEVRTISPMSVPGSNGGLRNLAPAPDGSVYTEQECRVMRIAPNGTRTRVAGTLGTGCGPYQGDGGAATATATALPVGSCREIAVAPDGAFYFARDGAVFRVGPDGRIQRIAGTGVVGTSGDGGPATAAQIGSVGGLALGLDGAIYIAVGNRIRRIGPDGVIETIAGSDTEGDAGDGGPARLATLSFPRSLAYAGDGSLYLVSLGKVRRIGPDGIIRTVPGVGAADAVNPTAATAVFIGPQDLVHVVDPPRIRRVNADGSVERVYGRDTVGVCNFPVDGCGEGGPPQQVPASPFGGTFTPDGQLLVLDRDLLRTVPTGLSTLASGELAAPSRDGEEVYVFDGEGRHLRTIDALTGALRWQFGYDAGRLVAVTDGDHNVTTIERGAAGVPTAIVASGGQRTTLALDADGWLASIGAPGGITTAFDYHGTGGLLATTTGPRGAVHQFGYDADGRLVSDLQPDRGTTMLARSELPTGERITVTAPAGLVTVYETTTEAGDVQRRRTTNPAGAVTEALVRPDGTRRVTRPDGTVIDTVEVGDPRFGMQAPMVRTLTADSPGGAPVTRTFTRTETPDPVIPFALAARTDAVTTPAGVTQVVWNGATRRYTVTTPEGRQSMLDVDARRRATTLALPGVAPRAYGWDALGRLETFTHGDEQLVFEYDAGNRLLARTDALGSRLALDWDEAEHLASVQLPSLRTWTFGWDAGGNRTSVTPPGGSAHAIAYDAADADVAYTPPANAPYVYPRDAAGRIADVDLPDGASESFTRDPGGRPTGIAWDEAAVTVGYDAGDATDRPGVLTRTPVGGGPAQGIEYDWNGPFQSAIRFTGPASGAFTYQYDARYQLQSVTLTSSPNTVTIGHGYDDDGLRTSSGPFTFTLDGPEGTPTLIADGTGALAYGYDALGRIASRTLTVNGVVVYDADVIFDDAGRLTTQTETDATGTHVFAYGWDDDGQLLQVTRDGAIVEAYAYDDRGNRTARNGVSATVDAQDRLLSRGAVTYGSDAAGFLATRGTDTFSYSTVGELLATSAGSGVTYGYDALRRRVTRTQGGGTTQYLYGNPEDDVQVSAVRDPPGTLTWYHYDDGGRLIALERGGSRFYVATDATGSPRVVADATGAVVRRQRWDAFGVQVEDTGPAFALALGFAGGLVDPVTDLVRFGWRDYEPASGRWTSRDPLLFAGEQGNLYSYVRNHPVGVVDRSGLTSVSVSVYKFVGVDVKLSITRDGISACTGAGVDFGSRSKTVGLGLDPFGDLDPSAVVIDGKLQANYGPLKGEAGVEVQIDDCIEVRPIARGCLFGTACTNLVKDLSGKPNVKGQQSVTASDDGKRTFSFSSRAAAFGAHLGLTGCQQAKW